MTPPAGWDESAPASPRGPLSLAELIQADDLDGLLVRIDHLCADAHWDGLVDLRDQARRALERGRQLWPAASHAEYRLALEAPGPWAAAVLVPGAARFALGPVSEVAASTHTWAELAPHAPGTPEATLAAHERVIRGEDLTGDRSIDSGVLEIPLRLQDWEPAYPVAVYRSHEARFDAPPEVTGPAVVDPRGPSATGTGAEATGGEPPADFDGAQALSDLVSEWRDGSEGRIRVVAVDGDATGAITALGAPISRLTPISPTGAMSAMAWAAASGGAHGRRRGMASGRFGAWWAVAALAGRLDEWPLSGDRIGAALDGLGWYRWDHGHPSTGWSLRLAVENPDRALAWAIEAVDPAPAPAGHTDHAPDAGTAADGEP